MERVMSFMQQEKSAVLTCLKSFLHDPLIEWKANEDKSVYDDKSVNSKIELVENRLNGYCHTLIYPKLGPYSVRGLVAKQIELAMDEKILSQMFIGWSAYV
jgi:serine/threonine-protein kinase ATR